MDTALISIIIIAIALAMDAFSVSLTKGFTQKNLTKSQILYYGLFFGFFQFIMPVIGYICGTTISSFVSTVAPWIAFFLLLAIGLNMIRESLDSDDEYIMDTFSFKELTLLAVATSIDAFAVGICITEYVPVASMYNNRNCSIYIQYFRYFHWKKTWKLFRRQIWNSWWCCPDFNRH